MTPRAASSVLPLDARVAVVTGASSGIGAATASLLALRGARVALLARRKDLLDRQVAAIHAAGGHAMALAVDVTDQDAVGAAARTIAAEFGIVNMVVNNAGIMLPAPIAEKRTADWEHMISLNLMGALRVIGAFVPSLLEAAAEGCTADLVNVSSIAAQNVHPNFAVYSATKAATSHLSRHLRVELGANDVRVSIVEPGIVAPELQSDFVNLGAIAWPAAPQTGDWLRAEDVAEAIAFTVALPRHVNVQQLTLMPTRQPS